MANWATSAEADTYLADKVGSEAWFSTDFTSQDVYLTTAHRWINNDPELTIPSSPSTSQLANLQAAEIELAFYILSNPNFGKRQNIQSQGVKSIRIGDFSETYAQTTAKGATGYSRYPSEVYDYLFSFRKVPSYYSNIRRDQEDIV